MEQKTEEQDSKSEELKEEQKNTVPGMMTAQLMVLKINAEIAKKAALKKRLTIAELESRALVLVKNEDNLKEMQALLSDLDEMEEIAEETFKAAKKPFIEGGKGCDDGKKLVFANLVRIRGMVEPDYDRLLEGLAERSRLAAQKEAQDKAIRKGIEDTAAGFAKRVVEASNREQLSAVERLINLEKSPSRVKKYGDFHAQAIKRYDEALLPIIQSQKLKLGQLERLHGALEEAQSDRELEEVGKLQASIGEVAEEIRQNQGAAEDILSKEFFDVEEVDEILPEFRTKRTDISYELHDAAIALKKVPKLLKIELDKKAVKAVAAKLKEAGAFEGKKELIVDGIKYIVTRKREAL
jgi:hypothetical protein